MNAPALFAIGSPGLSLMELLKLLANRLPSGCIHACSSRWRASASRDFAQVEQINEPGLINVLLTAEELTPATKLKRQVISQRHSALIDSMK
ncbi:hypothetical protein AB4144_09750 [Rhizobiaceae sp. 2RAB30]